MVAETKPESYEFIKLGSTYRVLPEALRKLKTLCFWNIPEGKKEKQPAYWNGKKWVFTGWNKSKNLEWIGDALRLSRELKVNIGLVVPDYWVVLDFDQCRDSTTGDIHPPVLKIIESLDTVVLISSSGTGLHVFLRYASDQQLPLGTKFTNPDLTLDIFTEPKRGELKKPGTFVAINWHPLPGYNALDKSVKQFPDLLETELFISAKAAPHTEPLEPIPVARQVLKPQTRAPREPEPKEPPFGIKWKPKHLQTAISMFNGFLDRPYGIDDSISGDVFWWLMFYWKAAEDPDWDEAFDLSVRAEGFYLNKQPSESRREPKPLKWHEYNVNNSLRKMTNKNSKERLVFREKGEKYGKTNHEDRVLDALKYAQSKKMRGNQPVFMQIITQSLGRTRFRITDGELAELTNLSASSITRAKKYFRKDCRNFLKIEGNIYTVLE